jgi:Prokaryotic N-terminal methylation motif
MTRIGSLRDQRGTTLVELIVGLAVGLVVLTMLSTVIVITLHGSTRVSARVEATQNGRVVLARVMEELHSACVSPKIAPVQSGSSGTLLKFIRAGGSEGAAAAPVPTLTEITYSGGVISQSDHAVSGGTAPNWTFSSTATTRQLMSHVAPVTSGGPIFSYFAYSNGALSETPQTTPLSVGEAALTVEVRMAITASPSTTPVADKGSGSTVQDSAVLRLTPPSFNEQAVSLPCQ